MMEREKGRTGWRGRYGVSGSISLTHDAKDFVKVAGKRGSKSVGAQNVAFVSICTTCRRFWQAWRGEGGKLASWLTRHPSRERSRIASQRFWRSAPGRS